MLLRHHQARREFRKISEMPPLSVPLAPSSKPLFDWSNVEFTLDDLKSAATNSAKTFASTTSTFDFEIYTSPKLLVDVCITFIASNFNTVFSETNRQRMRQNKEISYAPTPDIAEKILGALQKTGKMTDQQLTFLLTKDITKLNLSSCKLLTNETLQLIGKSCSNLRELDLHTCKGFTDKGFEDWIGNSNHDQLELINLMNCKIKIHTIQQLLAKFPIRVACLDRLTEENSAMLLSLHPGVEIVEEKKWKRKLSMHQNENET